MTIRHLTSLYIPHIEPLQPASPINVQVLALNSTSVKLSWNAPIDDPSSVTGYQVTYTNGQGNLTQFTGANVFTVTILGLEPGATYQFTVTALNAAGSTGPIQSTLSLTLPGEKW